METTPLRSAPALGEASSSIVAGPEPLAPTMVIHEVEVVTRHVQPSCAVSAMEMRPPSCPIPALDWLSSNRHEAPA